MTEVLHQEKEKEKTVTNQVQALLWPSDENKIRLLYDQAITRHTKKYIRVLNVTAKIASENQNIGVFINVGAAKYELYIIAAISLKFKLDEFQIHIQNMNINLPETVSGLALLQTAYDVVKLTQTSLFYHPSQSKIQSESKKENKIKDSKKEIDLGLGLGKNTDASNQGNQNILRIDAQFPPNSLLIASYTFTPTSDNDSPTSEDSYEFKNSTSSSEGEDGALSK